MKEEKNYILNKNEKCKTYLFRFCAYASTKYQYVQHDVNKTTNTLNLLCFFILVVISSNLYNLLLIINLS